MKKVFSIAILLSLLSTLCLSGCFFDEISLLYSDTTEINGFQIGINSTSDCCFVGNYNCTEYTKNLEITIPDDYDGIPIKRIGGYYGKGLPMPFSISLADLYMNASEGSKFDIIFSGDPKGYDITEEYVIEDVVFQLNIGRNIEVIESVSMDEYYPHMNDDGSITFYHPVVNITCSDDNPHFYSKDGKLYDKETSDLISVFAYDT